MPLYIYMKTGHRYRLPDGATLEQVNARLDATTNRFAEMPLHPTDPAGLPGTPEITRLFLTPESVSHFGLI